jgi:hypothetical protein
MGAKSATLYYIPLSNFFGRFRKSSFFQSIVYGKPPSNLRKLISEKGNASSMYRWHVSEKGNAYPMLRRLVSEKGNVSPMLRRLVSEKGNIYSV